MATDITSRDETMLEVALFITAIADFDIHVNLTAKEDAQRSSICKNPLSCYVTGPQLRSSVNFHCMTSYS